MEISAPIQPPYQAVESCRARLNYKHYSIGSEVCCKVQRNPFRNEEHGERVNSIINVCTDNDGDLLCGSLCFCVGSIIRR